MTVIDQSNCLILHEFADRYDSPPLKLTAWRIIQETAPAYAKIPSFVLDSNSVLVSAGNGLTGPAEIFQRHLFGEKPENDSDLLPSVLPYSHVKRDPQDYSIPQPDELPPGSSAIDVVRAWAFRLQDVYNQCNPENEEDKENQHYGIDYTAILKEIYVLLNLPEKISMIDQILDMYKGKESQMMQSILFKYQDTLPLDFTFKINEMLKYHANVNTTN